MSFPSRYADEGGSNGTLVVRECIGLQFHHALLVQIPQRNARARRWALARGIGEIDIAKLTAMVRAERLSSG